MSRIVQNTAELSEIDQRWVLALGTFDGVHLGHRAVLQALLAMAEEHSARPAVLFFDPLPRQVLNPANPPKALTSPEEKIRLMREFGVEVFVQLPFNPTLAALSPNAFLERYFFTVKGLKLLGLCCGQEWRFGAKNQGNVELLERLVAPHGIQLRTVPPVMAAGEKISSSRIRAAVASGKLSQAAQMLGRPYTIAGVVAHGAGIATAKLQTPTANLADERLQLPPYGVYAARTAVEQGEPFPGIVYIGEAPTLRGLGNGHPVVELHLFDFQGNLYGKEIRVEPVRFLRESLLFPNPEALRNQIRLDIAAARDALQK